jgi:hypothetical protein
VLLGRQRARRYQVTPAIAVSLRPRTLITAQYDATTESLGSDMHGELYIARLGVLRTQTPRDSWSVSYLGRTFANSRDLFNPASSERSHALMLGYSRALSIGTSVGLQAGPRVSTYGNHKPEILANLSKQVRTGSFGMDFWQGETIIMGIRGPVEIRSFSFKSAWLMRRSLEIGAHAGVFNSVTLHQGRARVFHPELVASYSPGSRYIIAASYGIDFQKGDVRSEFLADKQVVRHVVLFRVTFAPRLSRIRPADPRDPRSKGVFR